MLLPVLDPLQMVIHLRMQRLPPFARDAENGVVAAHPALDGVVQVERRFRFSAQGLDPVAFPRFALAHAVEADEGGGADEVAEDGSAAGFEEAGEGDGGLGAVDGRGVAVG